MPSQKRAILRNDARSAFSSALELAKDGEVDAVLIPGDLFDYESIDTDIRPFLVDCFRNIYPTPVFIAPGNHDSLRPGSPYIVRTGEEPWPDNVHIFTSPSWESIELPENSCAITGIAHVHRGITDRLLSSRIPRPKTKVNILLFHGSRDGHKPSDKESIIPFSDAELISQGFSYSAIGHYHSFAAIIDCAGNTRAAYSGCTVGRGIDEVGAKYVLITDVDSSGVITLEQAEVASRRVVLAEVDVTGAKHMQELLCRLNSEVSAIARNRDIVYVRLTGAMPTGFEPDTSVWEASAPYFHCVIDRSCLVPDYDLDALAQESAADSIKSAFVRKMLKQIESAKSDEDKRILTDAVYYGLSALDGRKLEPRDAN